MVGILLLNGSVTMRRHRAEHAPLSKNKFCGEKELSSDEALPERTRKPRRELVARRSRHNRIRDQWAETLGPTGVEARFAGRASRVARSRSGCPYGLSSPANAVDLRDLLTYRRTRWSCIAAAPIPGYREDALPRRIYDDNGFRILPSAAIVGGTAVT